MSAEACIYKSPRCPGCETRAEHLKRRRPRDKQARLPLPGLFGTTAGAVQLELLGAEEPSYELTCEDCNIGIDTGPALGVEGVKCVPCAEAELAKV